MSDEKKIVKKPKKERKFHPIRYLKEMVGEVKKLSWLSFKDWMKYTGAVIVFVLLFSALVYAFDQAFGAGIQGLALIGGATPEPIATEEPFATEKPADTQAPTVAPTPQATDVPETETPDDDPETPAEETPAP